MNAQLVAAPLHHTFESAPTLHSLPPSETQIKSGYSYAGTASSQLQGEPVTGPFTGTFNLYPTISQVLYPSQYVATGRLPNMLVSYQTTTSASPSPMTR